MKRLNIILLAFLLSLSTLGFVQNEVGEFQIIESSQLATEDVAELVTVKKPDGPVKTIQSAIIKLNQLTAVATYSPRFVGALIKTEIAPLFDFNHISNEILLVSGLRLGAEGRAYFTNKIKKNIITSLLSKLTQTLSTSFVFISARPMIGGSISVKLRVNGYYSYGMFLDLIFHQTADQSWKIADIVLNNDSLVNYYQKMVLIKLRRYGVYGMLGRL